MNPAVHLKPAASRILISCDTSPLGAAALDAAAALAQRFDAELAGVFVENINLLRMAALPFAREYALASATARRIEAGEIERMLRREAEAMRGALSRAASGLSVPWSFQVVRGMLLDSVLEAMREPDLAVFGYTGQFAVAPAAEGRPAALAGMDAGLRHRPILVLYDDTPAAARSLETARALAQLHHARLLVLVVAEDAGRYAHLCAQADAQLDGAGAGVRFQQLAARDVQRIKQLATTHHAAVLLWHGVSSDDERRAFATLVDELKCPVVLVR